MKEENEGLIYIVYINIHMSDYLKFSWARKWVGLDGFSVAEESKDLLIRDDLSMRLRPTQLVLY